MGDITEIIAKSRPDDKTLPDVDADELMATARRQKQVRRSVAAGTLAAGVVGAAFALSGLPGTAQPGVEVEPMTSSQDERSAGQLEAEARASFTSCAEDQGFGVTHLDVLVEDDVLHVAGFGLGSIPYTRDRTPEEHSAAAKRCWDHVEQELGVPVSWR